jgi:hypothetical protein
MSFMRVDGRETEKKGTPAFYLVGGFVAVSLIAAVLGASLGWAALAGLVGGGLAYYGSKD